jgi:sec-independent protein translocase protein TatC
MATTQDMQANTAGNEENELSFWGHLEELRSRIFKALIGIVIGCIGAGFFIDPLMNIVLLKPAMDAKLQLQNLRPFGQPFLYFKVVAIAGIIVAMPVLLYQLWKFIAPGLYEHERAWAGKITFFTTICFLVGIGFSYFVMIPGMLAFAATFGSSSIQNIIDVNEYFGFMTTTILGAGLIFELPMITYVLARFGIVTAKTMSTYRRHAIIVILIIAAIITPSPDPINQLIFAAPLYVLYELSIIIARFSAKPRKETPFDEE